VTIPTVQAVIDRLLAPLGWGALITGILSIGGWLAKKYAENQTARFDDMRSDIKEMRSNHLSHIEAYGAQSVALLQAQNTTLNSIAESLKDAAVAQAEIKTLLDINSRPAK
jgi:hypothetical protein